uniref:Uncharacterized protein n=1 Tax=Romanomermis culicivorax TaxID=13658 RepID=A0A915L2U4_ROMCU
MSMEVDPPMGAMASGQWFNGFSCGPVGRPHSLSSWDDIGSLPEKLMTRPPHKWTSRRTPIFRDPRAVAIGKGDTSMMLMSSLRTGTFWAGVEFFVGVRFVRLRSVQINRFFQNVFAADRSARYDEHQFLHAAPTFVVDVQFRINVAQQVESAALQFERACGLHGRANFVHDIIFGYCNKKMKKKLD